MTTKNNILNVMDQERLEDKKQIRVIVVEEQDDRCKDQDVSLNEQLERLRKEIFVVPW